MREIKWAEFTVTNTTRRGSIDEEIKFQKMHGLLIDRSHLEGFNIGDYYDPTGKTDVTDGSRKLTHKDYIYYKDRTDNGVFYYRIDEVVSTNDRGATNVLVSKTLVDEYGKEIRKIETPDSYTIKTIADLDKVFGGAYCMKKDDNARKLVYSDANIDVVNNIICNHDLKEFMIAFVVNASAQKVGQINVNSRNSFRSENANQPLK